MRRTDMVGGVSGASTARAGRSAAGTTAPGAGRPVAGAAAEKQETAAGAAKPSRQSAAAAACPIGPVVDLVFSRWTTPILWSLNEHGRQRFVELQRRIGTITPKVLTQRLRQMERDGLVVRTYHPEVPPRVEYEISELGRSLTPLFATIAQWSAVNLERVERARRAFDDGDPAPEPPADRRTA